MIGPYRAELTRADWMPTKLVCSYFGDAIDNKVAIWRISMSATSEQAERISAYAYSKALPALVEIERRYIEHGIAGSLDAPFEDMRPV